MRMEARKVNGYQMLHSLMCVIKRISNTDLQKMIAEKYLSSKLVQARKNRINLSPLINLEIISTLKENWMVA